MKRILLLTVFTGAACLVNAQSFDFQVKNRWANVPVLHKVNAAFDSSSAVCILDDRQTEYKAEGNDINIYYSYHKIVAIKDDKGIESFNKMYIQVNNGSEIVQIKARTILKNGRVINIDSSKIKQIEEEGREYKLFAFDGLEKGAQIEYVYVIKRPLFLFGSETYQNGSLPCQEARFALITPSNLRFSVKGYNGMKVSTDSVIGEKRIIVGFDTDIPELPEEKYAYRDKFLKHIDYKLSYNLATAPNTRMYTWKDLAKKAFSRYTDRTEKDEKALDAFITQMKIPPLSDEAAKLQFAEDYIKTNINIDKKLVAQEAASVIETVVKLKAANQEGIVKLFCGVFDKLNVNYQIVFSGDRDSYGIDEELEDWNKLDNMILYFPALAKFLSPMNVELRYPYIPFTQAGTRGLFLKTTTIGTFKTAVAAWADVKMEPYTEHKHNLEADIRFNATLDTLYIKSKQIFNGYAANMYRPIYVFLPKDKQDEATKEIIRSVVNSTDISNMEVVNTKLTDGGLVNKPLILSGEVKSTDLLENAGQKILFKVGEVIGPQVQMYQEKPRQLPVEIEYPHVLNRKIVIHLPAGYTVENLKDLDFDVSYKEDGDLTMGFVTTREQKGNDIELNIYETYKKASYPLTQFDIFKKVINASADFNKVTLVLKKN